MTNALPVKYCSRPYFICDQSSISEILSANSNYKFQIGDEGVLGIYKFEQDAPVVLCETMLVFTSVAGLRAIRYAGIVTTEPLTGQSQPPSGSSKLEVLGLSLVLEDETREFVRIAGHRENTMDAFEFMNLIRILKRRQPTGL